MLNLEEYNATFFCNLDKDVFEAIMGISVRDADELIFVDPKTYEK